MDNKDGDKEIPTPAEIAAENKGEDEVSGNQGDESKKSEEAQIEADLEAKRKQVEQLKETAQELTGQVRDLREEKRNFGSASNETTTTANPEPPVGASDGPAPSVLKEALDIFYGQNPEFKPENDVGNVKYNELNEHYKRLRPGSSVSEVVNTLSYINKTFISPPATAPTEEPPVPGIGDTTTEPTQGNKKDKMTRKLNKFEVAAAKTYPGGEQEYRKALKK
jgi:hypothetical protein